MLDRFTKAQDAGTYERALAEIQDGVKKSHWMWFIFPQLQGLGSSLSAEHYAIKNRAEAVEYMKHPVLRERLLEISTAVYKLNANDIRLVFGYPDYLKFQSCMTLFALTSPDCDIFDKNIQRYFHGERCRYTENNL